MGRKLSEYLREPLTPKELEVSVMWDCSEHDINLLYYMGYDDGFADLPPRIAQRSFSAYKDGYIDGSGDREDD